MDYFLNDCLIWRQQGVFGEKALHSETRQNKMKPDAYIYVGEI